MYVRSKVIKGHTYYYLVEGGRSGRRVKQKVIRYLGKHGGLYGASGGGGAAASVAQPPPSVPPQPAASAPVPPPVEPVRYVPAPAPFPPPRPVERTPLLPPVLPLDHPLFQPPEQKRTRFTKVPEQWFTPTREGYVTPERLAAGMFVHRVTPSKGRYRYKVEDLVVTQVLGFGMCRAIPKKTFDKALKKALKTPWIGVAVDAYMLFTGRPPGKFILNWFAKTSDADFYDLSPPPEVILAKLAEHQQKTQLGTTSPPLPQTYTAAAHAFAREMPPSGTPPPAAPSATRERGTVLVDLALDLLGSTLAAGKSEALVNFLNAAARLRSYSPTNQLRIFIQRPEATNVAGFQEWKRRGRFVKKGERGILITAPVRPKRKPAAEDTATQDTTETDDEPPVSFRPVYVFDVSQTEGNPLPTPFQASGDPGRHLEALKGVVARHGITITYTDGITQMGVSMGGAIVLRRDLTPLEEFTTLTHELAHELLHHAPGTPPPKTVRETEAEAVAHVVSTAIGLETTQATADYIQLYQGDTATLHASLSAIQHTAATILHDLEVATDALGTTPAASPPASD